MKVAYISHAGRPCYEYDWFTRIDADRVKFIDTDFSDYPKEPPKNVEYCPVDESENSAFKDKFHSTARLIQYQNFEHYLEDVDVVIVLEIFSSLSRQFIKYCREHHKPVVVLVYELIPTHPLHYLPTHLRNRLYCIRNANRFICVSEKAKLSLMQLGAPVSKIEVVYPGIDLKLFKPTRAKQVPNLIFVGGLKEHKGIDLTLKMADHIMPNHPDTLLTIVGDGPYRSRVVEYTEKYPNVKYLGKIPNKDLPDILNQHSIFVLPCRDITRYGLKITSEQFGFSFVEAMACGLAVISTDCGAIPEVITTNNIICPQGDQQALNQAVSHLLFDRKRREAIQEHNINLAAKKYDIIKQGKLLTKALTRGLR